MSRARRVRFRPTVGPLEPRLVLDAGPRPAARVAALTARSPRPAARMPLVDFINDQYAAFADQFRQAEGLYLDALASQSTGTQTVTATLTQPYLPGGGVLTVDNGAVFGSPSAASPLPLTAAVNGQTVQLLQATGRTGNTLTGVAAFDPATGAFTSPGVALPAGSTQLSASVPSTGAATAAGLFSTFVLYRAQAMAQQIVSYLNRLPIKLPRVPGLPRQPGPRNALQLYTTSALLGSAPNSLVSSLLSVPLPADTGSSLILYDAATQSILDQSRLALLEGMRLLFANRGLYAPISAPTTIPERGGDQVTPAPGH